MWVGVGVEEGNGVCVKVAVGWGVTVDGGVVADGAAQGAATDKINSASRTIPDAVFMVEMLTLTTGRDRTSSSPSARPGKWE